MNSHIKQLLILQDRDQAVRRLNSLLEAIPVEITKLEGGIADEEKSLADSKSTLQELEVKKNELDMQTGTAEEKIAKYLNQQLQVKKNDEYKALTHEIEGLKKQIGDWEEEEIGLMLEIDDEAAVYKKRQGVFDGVIDGINGKIKFQEDKKTELGEQLVEAKIVYNKASEGIERTYKNAYIRMAKQMRLPVVADVSNQTCDGCHLRISNEVFSEAKKGDSLTTCDSCGRIVYV